MISKNKIFLLLFCLFFLFANFCFVGATNGAQEDDSAEVKFYPQIGIPGSDFEAGKKVVVSGKSFIEYMSAIYKWSVGAIAIIAIVMIMIAGFQWMTAAGNASAIGQAKSRISSSLIGLLLAIGAYSILNFVNPSLVYLRTLDIGDIDYVDLNVSEQVCGSDGYVTYEWNNYHCFSIAHNAGFKQFFPLCDFGIIDDIDNVKFNNITIDLGLDENYVSNCDYRNNFKAISVATKEDVVFDINSPRNALIQSDHMFQWAINLVGAGQMSWEDLENDLYGTISDTSAAIIVIADFDTNNSLKGINVEVANKTAGKASAYIKNIKIHSNKLCIVCCMKKTGLLSGSSSINFLNSSECSGKWERIDPSLCCQRFSSQTECGNLDNWHCTAFNQFCNKCQWNSVAEICENKIP